MIYISFSQWQLNRNKFSRGQSASLSRILSKKTPFPFRFIEKLGEKKSKFSICVCIGVRIGVLSIDSRHHCQTPDLVLHSHTTYSSRFAFRNHLKPCLTRSDASSLYSRHIKFCCCVLCSLFSPSYYQKFYVVASDSNLTNFVLNLKQKKKPEKTKRIVTHRRNAGATTFFS